MNIDYEAELKAIADAQKRQKQAELEQAKNTTVSAINTQQDTLLPTFQGQRQQASNQTQVAAKNFAEYLAQRGQTNAGIGRQAERSRMNMLGNTISGINTQETTALKGFADKRAETETGYQNNLNSAYNDIDTNYMSNLYNARQEEQARQERLKQQEFDNAMSMRNYNLSARKAQEKENTLPEGMTFAQNGTAYQVLNGKVVPIEYAVKSTKTDAFGTKTTQYENQKQYDFNRQGYFMAGQKSDVTYKDNGATKTYEMWQKDGQPYIIRKNVPVPYVNGLTTKVADYLISNPSPTEKTIKDAKLSNSELDALRKIIGG